MLDGNEVGHRFYAARGFDRTGSSEFEIAGEAYPTVTDMFVGVNDFSIRRLVQSLRSL